MVLRLPIAHRPFDCLCESRPIDPCRWKRRGLGTLPRTTERRGALPAGDHWLTCHCMGGDRKSTRLNSSHRTSSYAVFCLKKKTAGSIHVREEKGLEATRPGHLRKHGCAAQTSAGGA